MEKRSNKRGKEREGKIGNKRGEDRVQRGK